MSCQQASRFITTATATTTTIAATSKATTATKRIATSAPAAAAAAAATTATIQTAKLATTNVVVAAGKTNTPEDPYVFTETIASTPPILFNAQKSRARLSEAQQHSRNNNNTRQKVANKKSSIVAATTAAAAAHIAQLNGITTATAAPPAAAAAAAATPTATTTVARAATTKAQASLGVTTPITITTTLAAATTTTNFNNVTQSQRQTASQSQLQLQPSLQLQLQSQASPKRATNVCVVRPQQQQQQQMQQQQQQQLKQQQAKLITKHAATNAPPPPLYTHTPSLWQTPLILDTTQKQQQQQQPQLQLQLQQANIVVATALVSPPTLPASLPSPAALNATPTAAVTAMVSPIVLPQSPAAGAMSPPKGGSLPPSKFHHTTLAQHLQKVECLKKKKSLPLVCQNSNNNNVVVELPQKPPFAGYNLTHPPPLTVFNTAAATAATTVVAKKKHSANAVDNQNDLNEIPVNVIFRKPPALLAGVANAQLSPALHPPPPTASNAQPTPRPADAKLAGTQQPTITLLGAVAPQFPQAKLSAPMLPAVTAGAVIVSTPVTINAPALIVQPATTASTQTEQMSSIVANSVDSQAATTKRKTPVTNAACRKGNKTNSKSAAQDAPLLIQDAVAPSISRIARRRKAAASTLSKRKNMLFSENELRDELLPDVAYCLQTRWLHAANDKDIPLDASISLSNNREREERIAVRKGLLRRQALQLLSTRTLQELPMRAARQRLQSVQSLLVKYQDHAKLQQGIGTGNRCLVAGCKQPTLCMAAHCARHIVNNNTQQIFQACVAWRVDGTACQAPVFDMQHTLSLCTTHSYLRQGLEQQNRQLPQQPQQQQQQQQPKVQQQLYKPASTPIVPSNVLATAVVSNGGKRKRKTNPNSNPVGRPQKRVKKQPQPVIGTLATLPAMPPMSAVLQRKSSTTSLESIASNSQSSAKSHSALQPYTPTAPVLTMPQLSIIPPALAPLSDYQLTKIEPEQSPHQLDANALANANFKAEEISQIVAQLAAASSELHHNNNNNSLHYNNNMSYCSNNNSNSGSSSISCGFPSFNAAFGNTLAGQQQNQHRQLANTTLDSTESLLDQHMFGICENSSAYASSEDTGLGGLSESELIGANDADDIALNGAHLLEEHDLVNVFDTLPDDAFNELFQSVQQAECEAMDRALEIADKNLKCLQQTIGVTGHDNAFLNDFLDVGDDLLVNAVMNSPNTSGIDTSTLFVDTSGGGNSSSNGAPSSSSNSCTQPAASVADIRGLVQT